MEAGERSSQGIWKIKEGRPDVVPRVDINGLLISQIFGHVHRFVS